MNTYEIALHTLIEKFAAPYGYAIVTFEFVDQDSSYKVKLGHFNGTHGITLIVSPDQVLDSFSQNKLSSTLETNLSKEISSRSNRPQRIA